MAVIRSYDSVVTANVSEYGKLVTVPVVDLSICKLLLMLVPGPSCRYETLSP